MAPDIVQRQAELEVLCRRFAVSRLELFGSAATDSLRSTDSDIDLLVEFEGSARPGYADRYFGLLESLERLFGRSIDLVVESAVKNPYFRQEISQSKTLLYAA
jgi:uncharacterized protein